MDNPQQRHRTRGTLMHEMGVSQEEIERRKEWLEFGQTDIDRLLEMNEIAQGYAGDVIESLYDHFLAFPETRAFFEDPAVLERVKGLQKEYFLRLTQGNYDTEYVENRLKIGAVHGRIGLDVKWYLGAYNYYLRLVGNRIFDAYKEDREKGLQLFFSLMKLVHLDVGLAIDTYIYERERTIRQQQEAIRELSTPVLQVRDRLLILPIIGVVDSQRARQITEQLLRSIRSSRAKVVVVDITGVPAVDTMVANHLVQTVEASRLMGAEVIVTGLSSEVAQTLVNLGIALGKLNTVGDLQGGIEQAERLLGYRVVRVSESGETEGGE